MAYDNETKVQDTDEGTSGRLCGQIIAPISGLCVRRLHDAPWPPSHLFHRFDTNASEADTQIQLPPADLNNSLNASCMGLSRADPHSPESTNSALKLESRREHKTHQEKEPVDIYDNKCGECMSLSKSGAGRGGIHQDRIFDLDEGTYWLFLGQVCLPFEWIALLAIENGVHSPLGGGFLDQFPLMAKSTKKLSLHPKLSLLALLSGTTVIVLSSIHIVSKYSGRKRSNIIIWSFVSLLLAGANAKQWRASPQEAIILFLPFAISVGVSMGMFWNILASKFGSANYSELSDPEALQMEKA